jgi:hypothetical protein
MSGSFGENSHPRRPPQYGGKKKARYKKFLIFMVRATIRDCSGSSVGGVMMFSFIALLWLVVLFCGANGFSVPATRLRSSSRNRLTTGNVPSTASQPRLLSAASTDRGLSTVRASPLPTHCIVSRSCITPNLCTPSTPSISYRKFLSFPSHQRPHNSSVLATSVSHPLP